MGLSSSRWRFCAIALVLLALAGSGSSAGMRAERGATSKPATLFSPKPPAWPDAYEMTYIFSMPYISSVQPVPLMYPVHIWYSGALNSMRVQVYDGLDETFLIPEAQYYIYPRVTTRTCMVINNTGGGPTKVGVWGMPPPLPDITSWRFAGTSQLIGKPSTYMWQYTLRQFEKVATYTFHTSQADGKPVHLTMMGVNLLSGSHFDMYDITFNSFLRLQAPTVFRPPKLCASAKAHVALPSHGLLAKTQVLNLLPGVMVPPAHSPAAEEAPPAHTGMFGGLQDLWNSWFKSDGDKHSEETLAIVEKNLRFILDWNSGSPSVGKGKAAAQHKEEQKKAPAASAAAAHSQKGGVEGGKKKGRSSSCSPVAKEDRHKVAVNKFISWSDERWAATMLGARPHRHQSPAKEQQQQQLHNVAGAPAKAPRSRGRRTSKAFLGTFRRQLPDEALPASVDWRGTGADGPVKDQASCGSCWTFATTGAMTGAWFLATNESLSLSEQQIVDCSWPHGVNGCWGGEVEPALDYIYDHMIASEQSYSYKGENSMCRENQTAKVAAFRGYLSVPSRDELALMEAVATKGPVAISFDAHSISFKYYSEGVYYNEECAMDRDHLNHAVTLVGYGTTPNGTDYWLLRNSWSQFWGDGGYFKIARKGNDCGITLDAVIAVVDEAAVARKRETGSVAYVPSRPQA